VPAPLVGASIMGSPGRIVSHGFFSSRKDRELRRSRVAGSSMSCYNPYMQHIYLVGLSGSGKSTVGRLVADRLGRPFHDTDEYVVACSGKSIPAIFAEVGEQGFRALEGQALLALAKGPPAVIATGGGMVLAAANRRLMAQTGLVIWLQVSPDIALARLKRDTTTFTERPLLSRGDPYQRLATLHRERLEQYREATVAIPTDERSAAQVADAVVAVAISRGILLDESSRWLRRIELGDRHYDVVVCWGGLARLPVLLRECGLVTRRVHVISDEHVGALYGAAVCESLIAEGLAAQLCIVPAGEESKSLAILARIYDWLVEQDAERSDVIIALGGGMIGDLAGFAAATYQRGVPLVQVPTSLLAQVDAAIGGKTGINHPRGKNLIGAFYQPRLVLADPATLLTLPARERTEGWAEVIKYGIILDANLFAMLEMERDRLVALHSPVLATVIARCIELKAQIVESDEHESGMRALLNYGHTLGHALEAVTGYGQFLHGEAVAIGMHFAGALACRIGWFPAVDFIRQQALIRGFGLPEYCPGIDPEALWLACQRDKKVRSGRVRWVLPRGIGHAELTDAVPVELVRAELAAITGGVSRAEEKYENPGAAWS